MVIEVYSKTDSDNYRIYKDVDDVLDSSDGESFVVYKFDTLFHDFAYKDYSWRELTLDEERLYEISSNNYEEHYAIGSRPFNQSLVCSDCERVIFIGKRLGNIFEIDPDQIAKLDSIEINGRRFEVIK